jgi:hypothetical protein
MSRLSRALQAQQCSSRQPALQLRAALAPRCPCRLPATHGLRQRTQGQPRAFWDKLFGGGRKEEKEEEDEDGGDMRRLDTTDGGLAEGTGVFGPLVGSSEAPDHAA